MSAYRVFLAISAVGSFTHWTAFTLNLVYQAEVVGLGPLQLVLVGTVMELVCLAAQVPTGVLADLYSRRLSVVTGYLLTGAGLLVWGLVPTYAAILLANVVWAIGWTCVDGAIEAWAADEIGETSIASVFARGAQLAQVGAVLGIAAAVLLARVDLALPIVAGGIAAAALGVALAFAMPERHFRPAPRGTSHRSAMRAQVVDASRAFRRSPVLLCLLGATLFVAMSSEGIDRLAQPHFLADLSFPSSTEPVVWFGGFAVASMLGSVALTEVIRRRADALSPAGIGRLLAVLQSGGVVALAGFALAREFWLAVAGYLVLELLREAIRPLYGAWLVIGTESGNRATVLSMVAQVDAAGQIAGGPPIGLLGQRVSMRAALAGSAVLMLPAVALLVLGAWFSRPVRGSAPDPATVGPVRDVRVPPATT